jgi:hypothetical protein
MKLRTGWFAAVAAGALALSTLTGFTGASTASAAASYTHLCVDDPASGPDCLYAAGEGNIVEVREPALTAGSTTNWYYPNTDGSVGQIMQANTDLCLQLDASDFDYVIENDCSIDDSAEQWINEYNSTTKRTMFWSYWFYINVPNERETCLAAVLSTLEVNVQGCPTPTDDWWMQWGTS